MDVGAGTGLLTLPLAETVDARVGDRHRARHVRVPAGEGGQRRPLNVKAVVAPATSLPLVEDSADLVVSNYCFHHLRRPDKMRALTEAARVLRPGGGSCSAT